MQNSFSTNRLFLLPQSTFHFTLSFTSERGQWLPTELPFKQLTFSTLCFVNPYNKLHIHQILNGLRFDSSQWFQWFNPARYFFLFW
jgi:hypothetical protein